LIEIDRIQSRGWGDFLEAILTGKMVDCGLRRAISKEKPLMPWTQNYNPLGHAAFSTAVAAIPTVLLFYLLAFRKTRAHIAGFSAALSAIFIAVFFVGMPWQLALSSFLYGAFFGWLPIAWIFFNGVLLYNLTVATGQIEIIKHSVGSISRDRRLQALLIAFSLGAIIEGGAGFGTPIAICASLLVGLGFHPFYAAVLCLIANTSPVAFGSLGIPTITLAAVTGLPLHQLSQITGRILPLTSIVVPLWLVRSMCNWKETVEVLPPIAVAGLSFALTQFAISNYHGPYLVDVVGGGISLIVLVIFLHFWKPRQIWLFEQERQQPAQASQSSYSRFEILRAWMPFVLLTAIVFLWGIPTVNHWLNRLTIAIPVPALHLQVIKAPPVIPHPAAEAAIYNFNWAAATGTALLTALVLSAAIFRVSPTQLGRLFLQTFKQLRIPLITTPCILGLGFVSRYSGLDCILGLAFTATGFLYPFFGTLLGWLGVFLTGSDTASNALFGNLQKITATQLGLNPALMCAANSCGGVMGKMVDAQSIVIGTAATNQVGKEGQILRFVFWHSVALASIVGAEVLIFAYVFPQIAGR
jgi:lactate permease